jgi:hypothetical protein
MAASEITVEIKSKTRWFFKPLAYLLFFIRVPTDLNAKILAHYAVKYKFS